MMEWRRNGNQKNKGGSMVEEENLAYNLLKRLVDILCSGIGLVILGPLFIFLMIMIKLESKGPAIFSQVRVGKNGETFNMYKFRSMVDNAEELKDSLIYLNEIPGPMFKIKNDPRITKVGAFIRKTSLDELPQLVNILRGEMSLVGPRPSLPSEVEHFEEWMRHRFSVQPGLTCYWQVSGRNQIGFEEWMKLDIKYIQDRSMKVDFMLILKTIRVLFGDKNAY